MKCAPFALFLLLAVPARAAQDEFSGVERVVAVGDVHGDAGQLAAVLRSAKLIDAESKWIGGKAHLVQTGDVMDRGPDSRKAMDLLMKLEEEAKAAGGAVHALIGNHEAMILTGDYTYLSAGEIAAFKDADSEKTRAVAFEEARKQGDVDRILWEAEHPLGMVEFKRAYGPQGKYGKWIRGHHAIVRIDGSIFLHGGISRGFADWTVRRINESIRAELADFSKLNDGIVQRVDGPLWYRGLALDDESILEEHLRKVSANYQVERIVVGHTIAPGAIQTRLGGKVIMIDVGMSRFYGPNDRMSCLVIEKGKPSALHRGQRVELPADTDEDHRRYRQQTEALDRESRR